MISLKALFEDLFRDRIETIYDKKLKGKVTTKPSDFDRDSLELGVYAETRKTKNVTKALRRAMRNLQADPHHYDNFEDQSRPSDTRMFTWAGGGQDYYKW